MKKMPQIGEQVSIWLEGEVIGMVKHPQGVKIEIIKRHEDDVDSHCFVSLNDIEPKG